MASELQKAEKGMWGGYLFGTEKFPDEVQVRAQIDRDPKTLAGYKSLFALEDSSFFRGD